MSPLDERERRPAGNKTPSSSTNTNGQQTANKFQGNAIGRQLCARRAEARRLPGGDPWPRHEPIGERGYPQAALDLLEAGLVPAPNWPALRSMWKAGGASRTAAVLIAQAWELAA